MFYLVFSSTQFAPWLIFSFDQSTALFVSSFMPCQVFAQPHKNTRPKNKNVKFRISNPLKRGGDTRIRTEDQSFAGSCLTTWLCRLAHFQKSGAQSRTWTGTEKNPRDFKSLVSTIPPPGRRQIYLIKNKMERETRVELATSTMARSRSTTELFPHIWNENRILSNTSLNFYNFFKKYQISCYFFYHWKIYIVF